MALKKYISLLFIIISTSFISAQNRSQLYIDYINNYAELAVIQQKEYGIPASITLAQGLLESGVVKVNLPENQIIILVLNAMTGLVKKSIMTMMLVANAFENMIMYSIRTAIILSFLKTNHDILFYLAIVQLIMNHGHTV